MDEKVEAWALGSVTFTFMVVSTELPNTQTTSTTFSAFLLAHLKSGKTKNIISTCFEQTAGMQTLEAGLGVLIECALC